MATQPVPDVYDTLLRLLKEKKLTKLKFQDLVTPMEGLATLSDPKDAVFGSLKNPTNPKPQLVFNDKPPLTQDQKFLNPMKILDLLIQFVKENPKQKDTLTKEFLQNFFVFQTSATYPTDAEHTEYEKILNNFLKETNKLLEQQRGGGLNAEQKKSITRKRKQSRPLPS